MTAVDQPFIFAPSIARDFRAMSHSSHHGGSSIPWNADVPSVILASAIAAQVAY
jgi:hypothetical protein